MQKVDLLNLKSLFLHFSHFVVSTAHLYLLSKIPIAIEVAKRLKTIVCESMCTILSIFRYRNSYKNDEGKYFFMYASLFFFSRNVIWFCILLILIYFHYIFIYFQIAEVRVGILFFGVCSQSFSRIEITKRSNQETVVILDNETKSIF